MANINLVSGITQGDSGGPPTRLSNTVSFLVTSDSLKLWLANGYAGGTVVCFPESGAVDLFRMPQLIDMLLPDGTFPTQANPLTIPLQTSLTYIDAFFNIYVSERNASGVLAIVNLNDPLIIHVTRGTAPPSGGPTPPGVNQPPNVTAGMWVMSASFVDASNFRAQAQITVPGETVTAVFLNPQPSGTQQPTTLISGWWQASPNIPNAQVKSYTIEYVSTGHSAHSNPSPDVKSVDVSMINNAPPPTGGGTPPTPPVAFTANDWSIDGIPGDTTGTHKIMYTVRKAGVTVSDMAGIYDGLTAEIDYEPCVATTADTSGRQRFIQDSKGTGFNPNIPDGVIYPMRIRYRLTATDPWSPQSVDAKPVSAVTTGSPVAPPVTTPPGVGLPAVVYDPRCVRTAQMYAQGKRGSDYEQFPHGYDVNELDKQRHYFMQDQGAVRRSDNGGLTWLYPPCRGLLTPYMHGGGSDPVNKDVLVVVHGNAGFSSPPVSMCGISMSINGSIDYTNLVLGLTIPWLRSMQHPVAFDKTTSGATRTDRFYVGVNTLQLYRFTGAASGTPIGVSIGSLAGVGNLYGMIHHPTVAGELYVYGSNGLYKAISVHTGALNLVKDASLPAGGVRKVELYMQSTNLVIRCTIDGVGLYQKIGAGAWTLLHGLTGGDSLYQTFASGTTNKNHMVHLAGGNGNVSSKYTLDGTTWNVFSTTPRPGIPNDGWHATLINYEGMSDIYYLDDNTIAANCITHQWSSTNAGALFVDIADDMNGFSAAGFNQATRKFAKETAVREAINMQDNGVAMTMNGGGYWQQFSSGLPVTFYGDNNPPAGSIGWTSSSWCMWPSWSGATACPSMFIAAIGYIYSQKLIRFTNFGVNAVPVNNINNYYVNGDWHDSNANICWAGPMRSVDGGNTFNYMPGSPQYMDKCPANNNYIYTATLGGASTLNRSADAGATWDKTVNLSWNLQNILSGVAFAADLDPNIIYTIYADGDLAMYNFSTNVWTKLNLINLLDPTKYGPGMTAVDSVAADPRKSGRIYATVIGTGRDETMFSKDSFAAPWVKVTYNLCRLGATQPKVNPATGAVHIATNGHGEFVGPAVAP